MFMMTTTTTTTMMMQTGEQADWPQSEWRSSEASPQSLTESQIKDRSIQTPFSQRNSCSLHVLFATHNQPINQPPSRISKLRQRGHSFFLPEYTTDLHKNRLLYDHSTILLNCNKTLGYILFSILHYGGHDSAFMFNVLCGNVLIF